MSDVPSPSPRSAHGAGPADAAARGGFKLTPPKLTPPKLTPPWMISILITLILAVGEWRYEILGGWERLALALGLAMLLELVLGTLVRGKLPSLQSAYVSGISATLLTKPASGVLWPVAFVAMLAIASKYALTYRGRHLWNPTNFSICALLLVAPQSMSILGSDFGNDLGTNLLIWGVGLVIVWRSRLLHVTLTYVVAFLAFALLRAAITGVDPLIEIAPITGPMYQLFSFFMVTDPRTTVRTRRGRILVTVLIAALECAFRLGNDLGLGGLEDLGFVRLHELGALLLEVVQPAPSMYALAVVGPVAMFVDLWRQGRRAPAG